MGRKNKQVPTVNQEACQKLNFLHQASHAVLAINPENLEMSRFYASTMEIIAQKLVFKLDPNIKRNICKHCHALLVPGVTARIRVRKRREKHVVVTCLDCKTVRRYLSRPDHVLWSEKGNSSPKKVTTQGHVVNKEKEEEKGNTPKNTTSEVP